MDPTEFVYPELRTGFFSGPKMIYAQPPTDLEERSKLLSKVLAGGPDLEGHPRYYRSFADHVDEVLSRAHLVATLYNESSDRREVVQKFANEHSVSPEDLRFLPLMGKNRDMAMILHGESGALLGAVDLDPWMSQMPAAISDKGLGNK